MVGWIWEDIQFVLVDVRFFLSLFDLLIELTFVHCAFSVDTPSNPRVSFLFHMLCCVVSLEDSIVASCWLLSSQVFEI
jgi:hypothetical protein